MFRTIPRATIAPLAVALVFCSTDLHAAWNWTFPFYHVEPAQPAPPPKSEPATPPAVQPLPVIPLPEKTSVVIPALPEPVIPLPLIAPPLEPAIPEQPAGDAVGSTEAGRLAPFTDAQTIKEAMYQEDRQWQGNLQLDGWVTVAPQATLTVSPGTVVRVGKGNGIHVLGRIVVKGAAENPVLFTSLNKEPLPGEWRGIILSGSEKKNILEQLRIEGAETALLARFSSFTARNVTISRAFTGMRLQECVTSLSSGLITGSGSGIVAENSELSLDGVVLEDNRSGIALNDSSLMATDVTLSDNRGSGLTADGSHLRLDRFTVSGSETGARIARGEGAIIASVFRDNSEAGAMLTGSRLKLTGNRFSGNRIGLQSDDHLPILWGNALFDNKSYNLLYLGEEIYYVGGNWFGSGNREISQKTVFSKRHSALQTEPLLTTNPLSGD